MEQRAAAGINKMQDWIAHPFLLPLLCASCWLAYGLFFPAGFSLSAEAEALPGAATAAGVEVAQRVGLFYKCFFTVFLLTGGGLYFLRSSVDKKIRKGWQVISGIGLVLLWLQLMGSRQAETEYFVLALSGVLVLYQAVQYWRKLTINHYDFIYLACLAIGLSFLVKNSWSGVTGHSGTFAFLWCLSYLLLFGLRTLLHRAGFALPHYYNHLLSPLAMVPLITVVGREFYFLCNHYGLYFISPGLAFTLLLLLWLAAWLFYFSPQTLELRQSEYLAKTIYPQMLVGLVAFSLQQLYYNYPTESFELANGANGIMRWFKFGEWPIFEWLSSHLLSDIDVRSLYCLLYGYEGNLDFLAFDFIPKVVFALVGYYFLKKTFDHALLAFCLALLFPFILVLIPGTHALALVTFFLLHRLLFDFSKMQLFKLGAWLTFLLLWKLEIGLSSIAGTLLVLTWYFAHQFDRKKLWATLQLGVGFIAAGGLLFLAVAGFTEIDLLTNFRQALDYFGAGQAHGYVSIHAGQDLHFQYHYFIFPFVIGCIGLFLIFQKPTIPGTDKSAVIPIAILFLIAYYLFNAQRGLVRHGLVEGTDSFISSFAYLIFGLFIYYLIGKKRVAIFWTCCALIFLIQNFKHKNVKGFNGYFEKVSTRFGNWEKIKHKKIKINRTKNEKEFSETSYLEFKKFMDSNFAEEATFIDFSTHPMLYFYTQRSVPSYFNQYLQNTVTEKLQHINITTLEKLDVPVVVYSKGDGKSWYDNHDGVPNSVRFSALSNYIYENYQPYKIINDYNIWIRNDVNLPSTNTVLLEKMTRAKKYELKKYPIYASNGLRNEKVVQSWQGKEVQFDAKPTGRVALRIKIKGGGSGLVEVNYFLRKNSRGSFTFECAKIKGIQEYLIPISSQYNWHYYSINAITISGNVEIVSSELIQYANED